MALAEDGPTSARDMAVLELNAQALGLSLDVLMENAGRAVAEEASRHLPPAPARVAVLVGSGNNGGDGTCAAHYLEQWGYACELFLARAPAEIRSPSARRCFERARARSPVHLGVPRPAELGEFGLVVDALLGTGQAGPLRGPYREVVEAARASGVPILSVDEPSGLGHPGAVAPKWTVALTAPKPGMSAENCGEIVVRDIGIPPEARHRTGPGEFLYYPSGRDGGHARPGRILVIGGGPFAGAPALAALGALRAGAERATVLAPLPAADRVQSFSPDLVVRAIGADHFRPADVPTIVAWLDANPVDAVVVGMGIGRSDATLETMRTLLLRLAERLPLVVDADALGALAPDPGSARPRGPIVATPNRTEYTRVFGGEPSVGLDAQLEEARRRAAAYRLTLLVKGPADLLSDGRSRAVNLHHPRALAVSGAGDVLGGVVGSLLARGVPPVPAVRLATYWVGAAGYRAAARAGPGLLATDVLLELGPALVAGLDRVGRRAEIESSPHA